MQVVICLVFFICDYFQEFEVTLTKIQGSLGFTLRKEDDSALGHYVRALVREPALSDGRIRAGDKIIAVSTIYFYSSEQLLSLNALFSIH